MTRCISCTRCIRFGQDVTGIEILGTANRGQNTEVGSFLTKIYRSEFLLNTVDLCPVGALTSKTRSYSTLTKEFEWVEGPLSSIDYTDAVGSKTEIYVNRSYLARSGISRITSNFDQELHENWISDKARDSFDAFETARLLVPKQNGVHLKNWHRAVANLRLHLQSHSCSKKDIRALIFSAESCDLETLNELKTLGSLIGP